LTDKGKASVQGKALQLAPGVQGGAGGGPGHCLRGRPRDSVPFGHVAARLTFLPSVVSVRAMGCGWCPRPEQAPGESRDFRFLFGSCSLIPEAGIQGISDPAKVAKTPLSAQV
jgi:hypothetical protein